jgi:hypothetical protein
MGRRKARRPDLALNQDHLVEVPIQEKSVHKRVPAVIHWDTVEGSDRTDDETIGEAIIYDDGTSDVIVFSEISADAKKLVGIINQNLDGYTIEEG